MAARTVDRRVCWSAEKLASRSVQTSAGQSVGYWVAMKAATTDDLMASMSAVCWVAPMAESLAGRWAAMTAGNLAN